MVEKNVAGVHFFFDSFLVFQLNRGDRVAVSGFNAILNLFVSKRKDDVT